MPRRETRPAPGRGRSPVAYSARWGDGMRLTDLRHAMVRTEKGEKIGRVFEVHCDRGKVTALVCGGGGLLERLTARTQGRRIQWTRVVRISGAEIVVDCG